MGAGASTGAYGWKSKNELAVSSADAMTSLIDGCWIYVAGCSMGTCTLAMELLRRLLLAKEAVLDGRRGIESTGYPFT